MSDNGKQDEKIIAVPFTDPCYNFYKDIKELPGHVFEEMRHFFSVYKQLENKSTVVDEVYGVQKAKEILDYCIKNYINNEKKLRK